MKDFYELTNRGRALRLRRVALAALDHYDLEVDCVRLVSNAFNGIFRVDTHGGKKYILRVCLPEGGHNLKEVRSEMMWLAALQRDTDLGVPQPQPTRDGELATTVELAEVPGPRHCVVFGWVPGPDLADRLTVENVFKLGKLVARLHHHALSFSPPEGFCIKTADGVFPFGEPVILFDDAYRQYMPSERRDVFQVAMERVEKAIEDLYADKRGLRVLHYDLHQWNVKVFRGKLYPFDFEDMMWGYPVQDIAITFYYLQGHEQVLALREAFRRGYVQHSEWPEQYPGELDALVAGRGLELSNFVLQDPNPDYKSQAPAFIQRTERRLRAFLDSY